MPLLRGTGCSKGAPAHTVVQPGCGTGWQLRACRLQRARGRGSLRGPLLEKQHRRGSQELSALFLLRWAGSCPAVAPLGWGPHLLLAAMQTHLGDLGSFPSSPSLPDHPAQYLAASATWASCPGPSSWAGPSWGWARGAPLSPPRQLAQTLGAQGQGLAAGTESRRPWTCT